MIPGTGEEIEKREVVKGYEYSRGQFLTFTAEELKALRGSQTFAGSATRQLKAPSCHAVAKYELDGFRHLAAPDIILGPCRIRFALDAFCQLGCRLTPTSPNR